MFSKKIKYYFLGVPADGWLISVIYGDGEFKEIKQTRAYNLQTLIGNAGGYVGLFVGYSLKEIPYFLEMIFKMIIGVIGRCI